MNSSEDMWLTDRRDLKLVQTKFTLINQRSLSRADRPDLWAQERALPLKQALFKTENDGQ